MKTFRLINPAGGEIPFAGTCGACRIKLLSGKVHMPVEDSLTEEEKSRGYILACQAQAESDVVVES